MTCTRVFAVLAAVALAASLAGCGGGRPAASLQAVPPGWRPPPPAAAPGASTFCAALSADLGHLHDPAEMRTTRAVEADFAGFFAALPGLVAVAPPAIRADAAVWAEETAAVYQALLVRSVDHRGSRTLRLDSAVPLPEAAAAVRAVDVWATASCRPDPLPQAP